MTAVDALQGRNAQNAGAAPLEESPSNDNGKGEEPLFGPVPPWAIGVAAGCALLLLMIVVVLYVVVRRRSMRKRAKRAELERQAKPTRIVKAEAHPPITMPEVEVIPAPEPPLGLSTRTVTSFEKCVSASLELSPKIDAPSTRGRSMALSRSVAVTILSTEPPPSLKSLTLKSDSLSELGMTSYEETIKSETDHLLASITARSGE